MNIEEIRKQYPMYSDLNDQELVDGFHSKFYSDISKDEFYSSIGFNTKEKTNILEDLGAGVRDIADTNINLATGIAGGLAGVVGAEDTRDKLFGFLEFRRKAAADREAELNREESGKVLKAVAGMPAYLNPLTAASTIAGGGFESGLNTLDAGGSSGRALASMGADLGINTATMGAAGKLNVASKTGNALLQGGTNVAQEALLNHPVQNAIREGGNLPKLPDLTPGDYAAAAIPGAVIGAMTAHPKAPVTPRDPSVPVTEPLISKADDHMITNRKARLEAVDRQIDKNSLMMADLSKNATMSEKQYKYYQHLDEENKKLVQEKDYHQSVIDKYDDAAVAKSAEEAKPIEERIADIDLSDVPPLPKESKPTRLSYEEFLQQRGLTDDARKTVQEELFPNDKLEEQIPASLREEQVTKQPWEDGPPEGRFPEARKVAKEAARDETPPLESYVDDLRSTYDPLGKHEFFLGEHDQNMRDAGLENPHGKGELLSPFRPPTAGKTLTLKQILDTPRQLAWHERTLESVNKRIEDFERAGVEDTDTGGGNPAKLYAYRKVLESKIANFKSVIEKGIKRGLDFNPVVKDKPVSRANPEESAQPSDPVFKNGWERIYQEMLTAGKSETIARAYADREFPVTDETNPRYNVKEPVRPPRQGIKHKRGQSGAINFGLTEKISKVVEKEVDRVKKLHNAVELSNIIDVTNLRPADEVLKQMTDEHHNDSNETFGSQALGFGQFVEGVKRNSIAVWETAKHIKKGMIESEKLENLLWHGNNGSEKAGGVGPFKTLLRYRNPSGLSELLKRLNDDQAVTFNKHIQDNAAKMLEHAESDMSKLDPLVKKTVLAYAKMKKDEYNANARIGKAGPYRKGATDSVRVGDFAVGNKTRLDDMHHIEFFKNKKEALEFRDKLLAAGGKPTDLIEIKRAEPLRESLMQVQELLDTSFESGTADFRTADKVLADIQTQMSQNAKMGPHSMFKEGYTGGMGTRMFKTDLENARDFIKSIEGHTAEAAALYKKKIINKERDAFWLSDAGKDIANLFPKQKRTADLLYEKQLDPNKKYPGFEQIDQGKEWIDNAFPGEFKPIEDTHKFLSNLFYLNALTTRMAFHGSQIMGGLFSTRQFLKEGTVLEGLEATSKATRDLLTGGDKEFHKFLEKHSNSYNTLGAQGLHEMSHGHTIAELAKKVFTDPKTGKFIDQTSNIVSGKIVGSWAESFSRYMVMAKAYHFYKEKGMSGERLSANVDRMVRDTMQDYSASQSSPFLGKMGFVGELVQPLRKYGVGQLGNLVGDIKYIAQTPGGAAKMRAMLPAISSFMSAMILSGTQGALLITEYEQLRKALQWAADYTGWDWMKKQIPPPVLESILTNNNILQQVFRSGYKAVGLSEQFSKDAATHGVVSAATGMDIGASIRPKSVIPGVDLMHSPSVGDLLPVPAYGADLVGAAATGIKKFINPKAVENQDLKNAATKLQVFPGQRYLTEKAFFDTPNGKPIAGGGRAHGQVLQSDAERVAKVLGTSTLSTSKARMKEQLLQTDDRDLATRKQNATDIFLDGKADGDKEKKKYAIDQMVNMGMTADAIVMNLKAGQRQRNMTREQARMKGNSPEQRRKFLEQKRFDQ